MITNCYWELNPRFWILHARSGQMLTMMEPVNGWWQDHTHTDLSQDLDEAKQIAEEKWKQ